MTASLTSNNRPQRKQLSEQIDRLDTILDGLSEGLNNSVADAAREGMRLALKDALVEIMTDPSLRAKLHQATAPEPAPELVASRPGLLERLMMGFQQVVQSVVAAASCLVDRGRACGRNVAQAAADGVQSARALGNLKNLAFVGVGVGATIGVVGLVAPHTVTAGLSGVCGGVAAIAVQLGIWTRRALGALSAT